VAAQDKLTLPGQALRGEPEVGRSALLVVCALEPEKGARLAAAIDDIQPGRTLPVLWSQVE